MSFVGDFIGDVFGGITGAKQAGQAAERAGQVQAGMSQQAIDEQRRQFDKLVELLAPYREAGLPALQQQQAFLGLAGQPAQQAAIQGIEQSPQLAALMQQGENAILQNASATGGLRGGNVQAALGQFRPQLLNQLLEQQYTRLGGLSTLGQSSAAGQAEAGLQTGTNIANLLGQQGSALAGGIMGRGGVARQTFGDLLNVGKTAAGFF
jgi:hypothetical protein